MLQQRPRHLIHGSLLAILAVASISLLSPALAATLETKTVTIESSAASATTAHIFSFDIASGGNVGSIKFEYCDNSPLLDQSCVVPTGLNAGSAVLAGQTGEVGFAIDPSSTASTIVISRGSAPTFPGPVSYSFNNVINPSTPSATTYVRITTYATSDASGSPSDNGSVAFSTAVGLAVGGFVPPYLTFCVGIIVNGNCTVATGNFISLGQLSSAATRAATSQFATATNDPNGYVVSVHGTTMTSGNDILPASNTPAFSTVGSSQFGFNLRSNSVPIVGQESTGAGTGVAHANYAAVNQFAFDTNSTLATSSLSSDFTVFTVSYIVNIASDQPPGIYNTTQNFIATASF